MANLTEVVQYDAGVYQIETVDPVQGGANGIANAQAKSLANRTAFLKKHVDDIESGATVPAGMARINSPGFTGTPTTPTAALGDRSLAIANTTFVQDTAHGVVSKNVGGNLNITLNAAEAGAAILVLSGALTGNIDVIVPATSHRFIVVNSTTGAFTLRIKTAAGAGVYVKQGKNLEVFCDGTGVFNSSTDFTDTPLTGTPTAPAAAIGDNSTQLVNTSFLQNTLAGVTAVNVAGGSNVALTQAQWGYGIILLTGALTANINVILPAQNDFWIICNRTTGGFTVTLKTAAGTGIGIVQGDNVLAYCDGTNIGVATPPAGSSLTMSAADARYALITNGTLNKPTITGYIEKFQALNPGVAVTVDPDNLGTLIKITTTQANTAVTLPARQAGRCCVVIVKYGANGHDVSFSGGSLVWANGNTIPATTKVAGKRDKYVFTCDDEVTMGQDGGRNF